MKKQIVMLFFAVVSVASWAQSESKSKIAIQEYDPVAYFQEAKAVKGNHAIASVQNGKTYCFSTERNKALFLKNPTAYEPQYGGNCAYGMSEGHEAPIQPEAFTIVDNKLYLNYNLEVRKMWLKEQDERIQKANNHWDNIKTKK